MCQVFAGQDPRGYSYETRSVRLSGHVTSVRLETRFWSVLDDLAKHQHMTLPLFLTTLYDEALEINGEVSNFASLLRCSCLIFLTNQIEHLSLKKIVELAA
jgi:predicted DNA-binding ribbon-helix-helix protein